jgi:hypothetical protein
MLNLNELSALLENAIPAEEETFDIRFEKTVSLVEQEKFTEAIPLIKTILNEGRIDIRLVMYLFYAHFLEEGVKSLNDIFLFIVTLIDEHWEKLSPAQMRDKHVHSSLAWFFSSISKKLRRSEKLYKEKRPDDFWNKSVTTFSNQDFEKLKDLLPQLNEFFTYKWEEPTFNQSIMFISKWLEDLSQVLVNEESKAKEKTEEEDKGLASLETFHKKSRLETSKKTFSLEEILLSSEAMELFFQKIQTFESLIDKKDFAKAALVSDDITNTIEHFDPSIFFPKLFSRYFALIAEHIDTLSQEWENKKSLRWQSLHRLYHTDLEEFIKW